MVLSVRNMLFLRAELQLKSKKNEKIKGALWEIFLCTLYFINELWYTMLRVILGKKYIRRSRFY